MKKFKIGGDYRATDPMVPNITVTGRSKRYIHVYNYGGCWRMLIRHDPFGNEYVIDSSVPKKLREAYTFKAALEIRW